MSEDGARLLPCPFCGHEADTFITTGDLINVGCPECNIRTRFYKLDEYTRAVTEWNRRDCCDNQKSNIPQMLLRYGDSIRFRCFVGDTEYEFGNLHIEMLEETTKKEICGVANEYDCAGHKVRMLEKRIRIE